MNSVLVKSLPVWLQTIFLPRKYGIFTAVVSPRIITYIRRSNEWPEYIKWWPLLVCGGKWDVGGAGYQPFREEQMKELFVHRIPYRETSRYKEMIAELEQFGRTNFPRCHSIEGVDLYFEGVLKLYDRIKAEGYRRRKGSEASQGEITIRIGRDGRLIKCGNGTHRHAIALLLGTPAVPVVIDIIHFQWASMCVKKWELPLRQAVLEELDEISSHSAIPETLNSSHGSEVEGSDKGTVSDSEISTSGRIVAAAINLAPQESAQTADGRSDDIREQPTGTSTEI